MPTIRQQVRLAGRLCAMYQQQARRSIDLQEADWQHLEERFEQARQQRLKVHNARSRGWHLAATREQERLVALMRAFKDNAQLLHRQLLEPAQQVPSLVDLLAELRHLETEFDEVAIDKEFVAGHTASVVLKGIDLGRFSLRLHWPRIVRSSAGDWIDIVALDPNPAASNRDVTHPHVRDERLCAGDATAPLHKALEQGRLTDAFQLIHSVLTNYNTQSAYVSLEDWEGGTCWNCSCSIGSDEGYFCDTCEHDLCIDCTLTCKHCDHMRCTSCQTRCDVCNEPCCRRCLTTSAASDVACCKDCIRTCIGCEAEVAPEELDEATELCPACVEKTALNTNEPLPALTQSGDSS